MVPEPNRSPLRSEAPLTVMCASIWAGDQYMSRYSGRETTVPFQLDLEVDVEPVRRLLAAQVGQRLGVLPGEGDPRRGQRVDRHDPGRDGGGERLAEERPERDVLPRLEVAGAPVVEQHDAEEVVGGRVDGDRLAERRAPPTTNPSSASMSSWRSGRRSARGRPAPCAGPSGGRRRCRTTTTVPERPW